MMAIFTNKGARRRLTAALASIAAVSMLGSLGACGSTSSGTSDETDGTISVFTMSATYEGDFDGYVGKAIKDATGVSLHVTPSKVGGTDRFQTRLTTGDLGDLILFNSRDALKQAIDAGQLLDLNTVKDKLPNVFRFSDAISRMTKADDGKVYGVPTEVSNKAEISKADINQVPAMRYDYYKELGSPDIKSYWDYKELAEQMVKAHPRNEQGENFYGLSLFAGWDSTSAGQIRNMANVMGVTFTDGINKYDFVGIDPENKTTSDILQDNSLYLQGLKWANGFYREGMLDPDSATQTWEDYVKKGGKGQSAIYPYGYMVNYNYEHTDMPEQNKGYELINNDSLKAVELVSTIGSSDGWYWGVSSDGNKTDTVLKFLDWAYSDEGAWTLANGPKGVLWDMGGDGKPELTELGMQGASASTEQVPEELGGGKVNDTFKNRINGLTIGRNAVNDEYGVPSNSNVWDSTLVKNANNLDKEWSTDHDGALNMKAVMVKNDQVVAMKVKDVPIMQRSDEDKVLVKQVGDVIKQYSWKMIYANSDSEFDSLSNEMISKAKNLGYDKIVATERQYAENYFKQ